MENCIENIGTYLLHLMVIIQLKLVIIIQENYFVLYKNMKGNCIRFDNVFLLNH